MPDDEADLLERARQGDLSAFREIYNRTSGFVFNTARRIAGSKENAEEITQDVFVSAHRNLGQFRGAASLKTWLYRITVNMSLNKVKSRQAKQKEVPYEEYMDTGREDQPDQGLLLQESERRVQALLNTLSAEFRACMVLREIEQLSYEDIAVALNTNINTVRTRLSRARRQLAVVVQQGGLYEV